MEQEYSQEYGVENIEEYYENLKSKSNYKINLYRMYANYIQTEEQLSKERKIEEKFTDKNSLRDVYFANIINDSIAVVKWCRGGKTIGWFPYVEGLPIARVVYDSEERAIIMAIYYKNNMNSDELFRAEPVISRVMNFRNENL